MSTAINPTASTDHQGRTAKLRRFLNTHWLRPENAYWMVLRSNALDRVTPDAPAIDLSCGDGVFTFLHAGGAFDDDFDVFRSVRRLDKVHSEHADIYDCPTSRYDPGIVTPPAYRIAVGTDWKQNLLDKAAGLGLYETLVVHDSNQPLPFESDRFRTTYCNSAYWVTNVDAFLREMRRITAPTGRVVLQVKLKSITNYTLERYRDHLGDRWLKTIGRGRFDNWPTVAGRATWEKRFADAGLTVEEAYPFVTRTHAHVWDIGLRPIAPLLIEMANNLTPQTRRDIKRRWVDLFCDLLTPLCNPEFDLFDNPAEPAEIQYLLCPR